MAEYIERGAVYRAYEDRKRRFNPRDSYDSAFIDEIPAANVAPVVHGRWIDRTGPDDDLNVTDTCSVCLHTDTHSPTVDVPYCWHCGARMGKEEN